MTILSIAQVSKTFPGANGGTTALQATDMKVAENDFITILGPSGCGKSTLLRMVDIDEAVFMGSRVMVTSARPGRIKLDRPVSLVHPRHYNIKTTPVFMELKAELTEQVRAEVLAAQAALA